MSDKPLPPADENSERLSDAEALFREPPKPKPKPKPKARPIAEAASVDQYEVQDLPMRPEKRIAPARVEPRVSEPLQNPFDDPWAVEHEPRATQQVRSRSATTSSPTTGGSKKPKEKELSPEEAVEEVWTRSAEWGATIASMVVEAILGMTLVYFLLSIEEYGWAFLGLVVAGLLFVFLGYPLMITLERPVRITPEQAVKDYYESLSHHFPHYVRMWLLLSSAGKVSSSFASFDGFRRYWRENLAKLRRGKASGFTPLKFQVQDFKSEKSAGKSSIEASFTVRVLVRGRQAEGAIDTIRVSTRLVKGPDRMWYLNQGTLR